MVSASTVILEYVCPVMGAIMGNIMFAAPYKAVKEAVARGHLGDLNPTPWAFMTGNTIGWIAYSFLLNNLFLFFANCPGFLLSVWLNLCAAKLQYEDHRAKAMRQSFVGFLEESRRSSRRIESTKEDGEPAAEEDVHEAPWQTAADLGKLVLNVTAQTTAAPAPHEKMVMGAVIIWTVIISIIALVNMTQLARELIVGVCVNVNLLFFYGAPLFSIAKVLKERNSASIHIWTMVTNTANGCFWTAYGFAVQDPFIYVPNGLGALLGFAQVILVVLFPRNTQDEIENGTTELTTQHDQSVNEDKI